MDIIYLVDRLENLITSSRRMPVVNQIMLKESDILSIVEQMRTTIPEEVKQARRVIQEKERILAQAHADASILLKKAHEETERLMNQQGLLRAAELRSQELVQAAEEKAHKVVQDAENRNEQLKIDADQYVAESLSNLKDHLANLEMDISRSILSIEKGLETLELPEEEINEDVEIGMDEDEDEPLYDTPGATEHRQMYEQPQAANVQPQPRRAVLANDTIGGPIMNLEQRNE